ncbi:MULTISPECIES: TonB family protein [Pandoraea]|uniref:energy transducer TonB family protein n=1 Tax=Pandoraea TaxID=93217 RepID=UPI001F5C84E1|nr:MULTISPECIES: TonB family protein [Pandoraea]MCI3206961.1 energy transducer TonB [Pandoraea sp. LA3]MDN4584989.1 energy transducer TonB [Pandoraea capi]
MNTQPSQRACARHVRHARHARRVAFTGWFAILSGMLMVTGCANPDFEPKKPLVLNFPLGQPPLSGLDQYKVAAAQRVTEVNAREITPGNPQPMLRSVVSLEYWVDRGGNVTRVALYRSNGDHEAERIAIASLRRASPLPAPSRALVDSSGRVRAVETWLFNNDGRYQLRSVAAPQIDGQ